jgi:hypothetical protein
MLTNGPTNSSVPKNNARDIKLSRVLNCADAKQSERHDAGGFKHESPNAAKKVRSRIAPRPATIRGTSARTALYSNSWHRCRCFLNSRIADQRLQQQRKSYAVANEKAKPGPAVLPQRWGRERRLWRTRAHDLAARSQGLTVTRSRRDMWSSPQIGVLLPWALALVVCGRTCRVYIAQRRILPEKVG